MAPRGRPSIKTTPTSAWREKLRDECFTRLEEERARLLRRVREQKGSPSPSSSAVVHQALKDIITLSSNHVHQQIPKEQATPPCITKHQLIPSLGSDGTPPSSSPSTTKQQNPMYTTTALDMDDEFNLDTLDFDMNTHEYTHQQTRLIDGGDDCLSKEDYEDLMRQLEESLYADLLREEAEYISSLEKEEIDTMLQSHFNINLNDDNDNIDGEFTAINSAPSQKKRRDEMDTAVICPLCNESWLIEHNRVILCPNKKYNSHLRIDISMEGLGLQDLKRRLASMFEIHSSDGCSGRLVFEQNGEKNMASLYVSCPECGMFELVV